MNTSYRGFIISAFRFASKIATDNFGKVSGITKAEDNNQVVTETDLEISNFLINEIRKTYPTHNIIDEEIGVIDNNSEYTWVIDPIDGTSNFAKGVPLFGIMIGLLKKDTPIAGGIALPAFSEICIAEKGKGAYCNNEKITISSEDNLLFTLLAYGIKRTQILQKRSAIYWLRLFSISKIYAQVIALMI